MSSAACHGIKQQEFQAGAMPSGFKQMLLLKIPAKQGIIAESELDFWRDERNQ